MLFFHKFDYFFYHQSKIPARIYGRVFLFSVEIYPIMRVRNRLKQLRLKYAYEQGRDVTKTEFARLLGIHPNHYVRYENQVAQPNLLTVLRISKTLSIPVEDIVYLEE